MNKGRRYPNETLATVAILKGGAGRGLSALEVIDADGCPARHFIPYQIGEVPASLGQDYLYAGLSAALDRLHELNVSAVTVQIAEPSLVDEIERRTEPRPELILPYITLGCKLNRFMRAKVLAVPGERVAALRARAAAHAPAAWGRSRAAGKRAPAMSLAGVA